MAGRGKCPKNSTYESGKFQIFPSFSMDTRVYFFSRSPTSPYPLYTFLSAKESVKIEERGRAEALPHYIFL